MISICFALYLVVAGVAVVAVITPREMVPVTSKLWLLLGCVAVTVAVMRWCP